MEKGKRLQGKSRIKRKRPAGTLRRAVLSSTGAKGLRGEPRCSEKKAPLSGEAFGRAHTQKGGRSCGLLFVKDVFNKREMNYLEMS